VELSQRDPRSIDIEHIEERDEHVVEMASSFVLWLACWLGKVNNRI
jgi:hypothetical protein